jgi:hypothetical protein
MSSLSNCQFYCLSFNDEEKEINMIKRFDQLHIDCILYKGVQYTDPRLINRNLSKKMLIEWSCCYGHLDMIYNFYYNSDKFYGIFCENDIHIHKNLTDILPKVLSDFNILNLDILLLGYLTNFVVNERKEKCGYSLKKKTSKKPIYSYHNYPDNLVGTQMYILTRKHAKYLIDKYYQNYTDENNDFISDIIVTKDGNRALISPVLAVEEKINQNNHHKRCHKIHYDEYKFI